MIKISSLSKSFGPRTVLDGVSLTVEPGETVVLLGPSGSGKTTLLRCLVGLVPFDSGELEVDGIVLHPSEHGADLASRLRSIRRKCGYVFQQYNLFPHCTVMRNLTLGPETVLRHSKEKAESRARELLRQMGLADKERERPSRLSGGEQQRVAIARALAMNPHYLLYDEPTSALDPARAREVWDLMNRLTASGQAQIVVTHQEQITDHLPCRVIRMKEGKVVEEKNP